MTGLTYAYLTSSLTRLKSGLAADIVNTAFGAFSSGFSNAFDNRGAEAVTDGLTVNARHFIGNGFTPGSTEDSVVFGMAFTGLDGSSGGIIAGFETAYVGFDTNGDFVGRCGNGQQARSAMNTGTAFFVDSAGTIAGDGTLIVEFYEASSGLWTINTWWNNTPVAATSRADNTTTEASWSGTGNASYLLAGGSATIPPGEVSTSLPTFTSASALRIYEAQSIS